MTDAAKVFARGAGVNSGLISPSKCTYSWCHHLLRTLPEHPREESDGSTTTEPPAKRAKRAKRKEDEDAEYCAPSGSKAPTKRGRAATSDGQSTKTSRPRKQI